MDHSIDLDYKAVNTLRFLAADAVQKANSGHPGLPLGAAPAAFALFANQMNHNPKDPNWFNRDRFVLSAGHGSALLYAILHLFNYGLTIDDLKAFRQLGSKTPGHPEYGHTVSVETTTGPLGQGIANAVGMAIAETVLAEKFNQPEFPVVDHYTYCLCGDGCLMEGVSSEAASLAGTLGLSKLILLYDSNNISIEGSTSITFRENVGKRFEAYGWQVILVEDGNDLDAINKAVEMAKAEMDKPTLIEIKTQIGFGAPNKQGKASAHGEPLGTDEIKAMKEALGWPCAEDFTVPEDVKRHVDRVVKQGLKNEEQWLVLHTNYKSKYPELSDQWDLWFNDKLPVDLLYKNDFWDHDGDMATRASSEIVLNKIIRYVPNIIGGSADLAPSTKTVMKGKGDYSKENREGANLHYGVREFAMTAIANGIALHGGLRTYIAGFFVFSDYMKPALRMASIMSLPVISVLTHDSIGVGEDGPTHQPVEQLASLRSIPNLTVIRPCDYHETAAAWYAALTRKSPTVLVLSRQNLVLLKETGRGLLKGAYVLKDTEKEKPDVLFIATGSEVALVYEAAEILNHKGIAARVISMPSWELFEEQTDEYKEKVLPKSITRRIIVEAASSFGWHKYAGNDGVILSIDTFGASAPADMLFKQYRFTVEHIADLAVNLILH